MAWDIYGGRLASGYCEVHPDVPEPYPCSHCIDAGRYDQEQPGPCEDCYYATGKMQDCDGSCQNLPMAEWDYFRVHPEQLAQALAAEEHRRTYYVDGAPRDQPRRPNGQFAPALLGDPGPNVL